MTLTFIDLYNECAGQPWSMFDAEAESQDDFETALKISINKAISYLWNFQPWKFKIQTMILKTRVGRESYGVPDGNIIKKTINGKQYFGVRYSGKNLEYADNFEELEAKEGEPEYFYIDGENIYVYPTPDDIYKIEIRYYLLPYGLNEDGENIYELTNETDYINIPEKYEVLFKNCLISLAMMYAIAEETDENYSGYKKQYEDALAILIKFCKNGIFDRNIVW